MSWQIAVEERAQAAIRTLDPALKEELIVQVDRLAASPAEFLTRSPPMHEFAATHMYAYTSDVVPGLRVSLFFRGLEADPPRLDLVAIGQVMEDDASSQ